MNTYELAISLEHDMEKYYIEQANIHSGNHLEKVFLMLADAERAHAKLLTDNKEFLTEPIEDKDIVEEASKLFKNLGDIEVEGKEIPSQLDSYRKILEFEVKSRDMYNELQEKDPDRKEIYKYLEKEEDKHCIVLEEIIKLTSRPEEWVESAEFGHREEY